MATTNAANKIISDRDAKIGEFLATVEDVKKSGDFLEYLATMAKFHNYSWGNCISIILQRPEATRCASKTTWAKLGRTINQDARSIWILAPNTVWVEDKNNPGKKVQVFTGHYHVAWTYDISDTSGDPLPEIEWESFNKIEWLQDALTKYAESIGIRVEVVESLGGAGGVSKMGAIAITEKTGTRSLVHEIVHEILHKIEQRRNTANTVLEIEADAATWVVMNHFGVSDESNANYIALWTRGKDANETRKLFENSLENIQKAASQIIKAIEKSQPEE